METRSVARSNHIRLQVDSMSQPREFSSDAVATSVAQMRADHSGEIHSVWRIDRRFLVLPGTHPSELMRGIAKLVRIVNPRGAAA